MQLLCVTLLLLMTGTRSKYIVERSTVDDSLLFNDELQNSSTCNSYNAVLKSNNSCSCPLKSTFFSLNGKAACISGTLLAGCPVVSKNSPSSIPVVQLNVTQQFDLQTTFQCSEYPIQASLRRWKNGDGFYEVPGASALLIKLIRIGAQYQYTLLVQANSFPQEFAGALLQLNIYLCGVSTCFRFKIEGNDQWSLSKDLVSSSTMSPTSVTTKTSEAFSSTNIYTSFLPDVFSMSQFLLKDVTVSTRLPDEISLSIKTDSSLMTSLYTISPSLESKSLFTTVSSSNSYLTLMPSETFTQSYSTESIINSQLFMTSQNIASFSMRPSNILIPSLTNSLNSTLIPSLTNTLNSTLIPSLNNSLNSTLNKLSTTSTNNTSEIMYSNRSRKHANDIVIGIGVGLFIFGLIIVLIAFLMGRRQYRSRSSNLQIA